jgi:hypothetical protein
MPVGAYSDSTIHVPVIELRTPLPLDTAADTRPLIGISRFACQYRFDCGVGSRRFTGVVVPGRMSSNYLRLGKGAGSVAQNVTAG